MFTINATIRHNLGKSASRRLRIMNKIPAIMYGGRELTLALELNHDIMLKLSRQHGLDNAIILLSIDGNKPLKVKIQAMQYHPFKKQIMHIDFMHASVVG